MNKKTSGIHHITAMVGDPQENVDFYAGVLGLRLVKKTINFDDPGTYHLYFGNEEGQPGTIITFFPFEHSSQGIIGAGQVGATSYVVPKGSMAFWEKRLTQFNVSYQKVSRFGETHIKFADPHGLRLEIVERDAGAKSKWQFGAVTPENAIKGFGGATLLSKRPEKTMELLEKVLGFEKIAEEADIARFQSSSDLGNTIDVKLTPTENGLMGIGTVHHIAFRANDDADQLEWQEYIRNQGYQVTPVQDRSYFNAIYFKEHGDILFEIATDPPGFTQDESTDMLGTQLKLPSQYEQYREQLDKRLKPIVIKELD